MIQANPIPSTDTAAPKAAAISGIVCSLLLIISLVILLRSIPANVQNSGTWLSTQSNSILLGLHLVPFSGIAFLWFMGVVRDRLGSHEDRFISTVFLGSGLLFVAMLFAVAAITGTFALLYSTQFDRLLLADYYNFGRLITHQILNTYMLKMAGVFMISSSTLFLRGRVIPKGLGWLGYGLAAVLLLRISHLDRLSWIALVFPLWVLLISLYILMDNYHRAPARKATSP